MKSALWPIGLAGLVSTALIGSLSLAEQNITTVGGKHQVMLILSGKFCDSYPEDLERALKDVSGVKAVDLKSKPGHALVDLEPDKVKTEQLVAVVDTVKGTGWYCKAQAVP